MKNLYQKYSLLILLFSAAPLLSFAQAVNPSDSIIMEDDDLNIGGDIFSDFNEDLEATQVLEDERFYRYGRFFSFQIGLGLTSFDGNRGTAYENDIPSYTLGLNYFSDFRNSFGLGIQVSNHHFFIDQAVNAHREETGVGLISVTMLRVYFSYRHYVDTSNLGTAITWSNPYFTGRLEYWYTQNKFTDQEDQAADNGGGLGFSGGFGMEFPIRIKEYYVNVEFLVHSVNFHDRYTQNYAPIPGSTFGYDDLTGRAYSTMVSYVISW